MSKLNVQLTQDYRLTADSANFIVQLRKVVDPTRAPGYRAEEGAPAPQLSEKYVDVGYYSLTSAGLASALDSVRIKSVCDGGHETFAAFVAALANETQRILSALRASGSHEFTVELAS